MASDYLPTKDADFDNWVRNFSTLIAADPLHYGVSASEAVQLQTQNNDWHTAYLLAIDPGTRTKPTVAAKNALRAQTTGMVREMGQRIKANQGVDVDDLIALGLHLDDGTPTPFGPPATSPILAIIGATRLQHTLRYADQNTPNNRAKPANVFALEVFVGLTEPAQPEPAQFAANKIVTHQPFAVDFTADQVGKRAWYQARWIGKRGQPGPWSQLVSMVVG